MDVTPQVSRKGQIILHIHPSVSKVKEQIKSIDLGRLNGVIKLPLAQSTRVNRIALCARKNGQVIAIGGLMARVTGEDINATPGLTNIPFFGAFFRNNKQISVKSELVILLRRLSHVIKPGQESCAKHPNELVSLIADSISEAVRVCLEQWERSYLHRDII